MKFLDLNPWLLMAMEKTFFMCLDVSNKLRYLRFCFKLLGLFRNYVFYFKPDSSYSVFADCDIERKKYFMCFDASRKFVRKPNFRLQITCVVALLTQYFIDTYCYLRMKNVAFSWLLLSKKSFSRQLSSVINTAEINII